MRVEYVPARCTGEVNSAKILRAGSIPPPGLCVSAHVEDESSYLGKLVVVLWGAFFARAAEVWAALLKDAVLRCSR